MDGRRTTLADIAARAGVSKTVVSGVLAGKASTRVSIATRERILQLAESTSYRPHSIARKLASQRTFAVGFCIARPEYLEDTAHAVLGCGIMERLLPAGYSIQFGFTQRSSANGTTPYFVDMARERAVDGFIVYDIMASAEEVKDIQGMGYPVVTIDRRIEGLPAVLPDYGSAIDTAFARLVELGHKDIVLTMFDECEKFQNCVTAYESAKRNYDAFSLHSYEFLQASKFDIQRIREEYAAFIKMHPLVTAFVAVETYGMRTCLDALRLLGYRVPQDFSVFGVGETLNLPYQGVLTNMHVPRRRMGQIAARIVLDQIGSDMAVPEEHLVELELVEGASSSRPLTGRKAAC